MLASRFLTENGFIFPRSKEEIQYLHDIGCECIIVCHRATYLQHRMIVTTFYAFTKDWYLHYTVQPCSIEDIKYILKKVQSYMKNNDLSVIYHMINYLTYTKHF